MRDAVFKCLIFRIMLPWTEAAEKHLNDKAGLTAS